MINFLNESKISDIYTKPIYYKKTTILLTIVCITLYYYGVYLEGMPRLSGQAHYRVYRHVMLLTTLDSS